jgi:hypothetical protein
VQDCRAELGPSNRNTAPIINRIQAMVVEGQTITLKLLTPSFRRNLMSELEKYDHSLFHRYSIKSIIDIRAGGESA